MRRIYHHFINRVVETRIAAGDSRSRGEIRREAMVSLKGAYRYLKVLISRRHSIKNVERWLKNYDAASAAKTKIGKWFNRLVGFVLRRRAGSSRRLDPFLKSFIDDQKISDEKFRSFLEGFAFFSRSPSREEKWSAFSSILKALIEYFQRGLSAGLVEAESVWQISVRGLSEQFRTFQGHSDRISIARDLRDCVEKLFSFSPYNPAIYVEFVEEDGEFKFDYRYGRDDEGRSVSSREPDYSIYMLARF